MTDGQQAWQQQQPPPQQWMQQPNPNQYQGAPMGYPQQPQYMQQPQYHQPPPQQPPAQQYQTPGMPPMPAPVPPIALPTPGSRRKPNRDPGAPKRNMSAYLLYQNAMREQFKAQNPGMSFGQLSKYTSAMYAQLTPEQKGAWQARAEADKARYERELSTYVPPPGYDQRGEQLAAPPAPAAIAAAKVFKGSVKRVMKDANAPKKNVSAYLLYQNAMRDKFKRDNPGMSFGELSKHTSHMYKNLSTEEKAAWEQVAQQDKERYEAELAAYQPPPGHDARGHLVVQQQGAYPVAATQTKRSKRSRDPTAPKRNKGSFVLFAEEERPRIKAQFPDVKFTDMGKILGERWRALSPNQKARYEHLAAEDKARFNREMEDYNRSHGLTSNKTARPQPPPQSVPDQNTSAYGDPSMSMYQGH